MGRTRHSHLSLVPLDLGVRDTVLVSLGADDLASARARYPTVVEVTARGEPCATDERLGEGRPKVLVSTRPPDALPNADTLRAMWERPRGFLRGRARRGAQNRFFGELLGYPSCCIEAYAATDDRDLGEGMLPFYARAAGESPGPFPALLNTVPTDAVLLVAHYPCRYDCRPSLEAAAAHLEALSRGAPDLARRAEAELEGDFVVFASTDYLALRGRRERNAYLLEAVTRHSLRDPALEAWCAGLEGTLPLDPTGTRVTARGAPPHRLLSFRF